MAVEHPIVEHKPWVGPAYASGLRGQHIAIVAYSHHYSEISHESTEFTKSVIKRLLAGDQRNAALMSIQKYFGASDDSEFWNKVVFFNFLPSCVGESGKKYGRGTVEQGRIGRERFKRVLFKHAVEKALIFTKKGWSDCPRTIEELATGGAPVPLSDEFPEFSFGTYRRDDHLVSAYGLRHPQGADLDHMRRAVRHIMSLPLARAPGG